MPSIDERIVSAAFENAKFEAAVAVTMATLAKLDDSLKKIGTANSLGDIEKEASKVTLQQPMSALDKLKARLFGASQGAAEGLGGIEQAGNKVTLESPIAALNKVQAATAQVGSGAADGFNGIEQAANRVSFQGLSSSMDSVTAKFSVMEAAAAVALGNIATKAITAGTQLLKGLTVEPVMAGFKNYETQINAVGTIMANTGLQGEKGLGTVQQSLDVLNKYANQTVYNFSEMAKNIGTFTAAGVNLDTATASIKGIANLAALSGSNSQQASTAMYQLSQAIAAGKVNLQDWNSVVNAGMGGQVFQKALFNTGKAMGTITNSPVSQTFEEWKKAGNSFRQSLSATQKTATDGTSALAKAQKDGTQAIKDAHAAAADAVANAARRLKDAQSSEADAIENAAKRVKDAQKASADAAQAAADRVAAAQKNVADTAKQATADIRDAQAQQRATFKQSADSVKAALDSVKEARKQLAESLKPPSADESQAAADKLKTAQLDQADLATAVTDAQTEQKRSAEDLAAAQKHLADLRSSGASSDQILSATRAVEDAQHRAADDADAVERAILAQNAATRDLHQAQTDLTDLQKKGTDEDQKVIDSRDALTVATQKYRDMQVAARKADLAAEKNVADVRKKSAEAQKAAGKSLAEAEKAQSESIIKNREAVAQAEKDQTKTIVDSRQRVADAEKDQAKTIIDSRKRVADAEENASQRIKTAREALSGTKGAGPPSWLTSDVLTNTLKQFTGDLSVAQLKAQGFNDAQIKAIQATGKVAVASATNIKTVTQLMEALKEEVGTAWATVWKTLFGNVFQATSVLSKFHVAAENALTGPVYALNKVLQGWAKLGGRSMLIEGLKQGMVDLHKLIQPVQAAFRDIFPPATAKGLLDITKNFRDLMDRLEPSAATVDGLRRTFAGFFAVLHIGWTIIKDVVGVFAGLLGVAGKGGGGFLKITGSIGDMVVALDKALTKGGLLKTFFGVIESILKVPIQLFSQLAHLIGGLFGGGGDDAKATALSGSLDKVGKAAAPLTPIMESLKKAWDGFLHVLQQAKDLAAPWLDNVGNLVSNLGTTLADAVKNLDFNKLMGVLQTGFIGGIFLVLKKAIQGSASSLTGTLGGLNKVFSGLTGNLEAMQQKIKAQTIFLIAASIGVLAASTLVLSTIDPKRLASALTAMAVGLGELMGAVKLMTSGMGVRGIALLPVLGAGLILVATSTVVLAGAMKLFATMSWADIAKGLVGVGGGLAAIGIGMRAISSPQLLVQGPALIAIGIALNILALAVKQFGNMKWDEMAKGLAGVLGVLIAVAAPLSAVGPSILLIGPGLVGVGIALNLMAHAVESFGKMDVASLAKGILGIGAALIVLGLGIAAIPPTVALQAAGLVILSVALTGIAGAIGLMGKMNIGTLVKGLATLGGVLVILAVGLDAMSGTLAGSAALLVAASALALLAPTLGFMGTLNWGTIFKGLAAMALVLGTLSVVGAAASSGLITLGIALLPLAGVLVLTAGGVFLFAKALALLGDTGSKGIAVMVTAITAFVALLPNLIISLLKGLVDVVGQIAELAPKIVVALGLILDTIIAFVIANAAKLAVAIGTLVDAGLAVLVENAPKIIAAGATILLNLLSGIDQNIEQVTTRAASIVVKFLGALATQAPALTAAGVNFLVKMLDGIAAQVPRLVTSAIGLVMSFIGAVVGQLPKVLTLGIQLVGNFITGIIGQVGNIVNAGLRVVLHIITGIGNALPRIVAAAGEVITKFVNAIADVGPRVVDAGFKALIQFLHGIAQAIRENNPELVNAGIDIASAIVHGMVDGLGAVAQRVLKPVIDKLFEAIPGWARKILGIHSPSKVFMQIGQQTAQGMVVGLQNGTPDVASAAGDLGDTAVSSIQGSIQKASNVMTLGIDSNPTITPVLDLTHVRSGMGELNKMTDQPQFAVAAYSSGLGSSVSSETQNTQSDPYSAETPSGGVVQFTQNNYSPESLNPTEVYRQTSNQLSLVKSGLGFATLAK
jgi:tape measure domain-containing protein